MNAEMLVQLVGILEACRKAKSDSATIRHLAKAVRGVAASYSRTVTEQLGPPLNRHGLTKEEVELLKMDRKIPAIASVRKRMGLVERGQGLRGSCHGGDGYRRPQDTGFRRGKVGLTILFRL